MSLEKLIFRDIKAEDIRLSEREAALRLAVPTDFDRSATKEVEKALISAVDCKLSARRVPIIREDGALIVGSIKIQSSNLSYALDDSKEAFVFGVTLGMGVERLLLRLSKLSVSEHYMADALASAYAEAAIDRAQEILDGIAKTKLRFSPGYGDLPLEIQPYILSLIEAEKYLGITLSDGLLMKPQKSITAIVGIENEK
ncbi:MAG: hypothetical protein IJF69_00570 [Clostridia bacterium]|nr:hypothetical protein [Clostridia bacterium]